MGEIVTELLHCPLHSRFFAGCEQCRRERGLPSPRAPGESLASTPQPAVGEAGAVKAVCHALCQSGKFETGQGGCAAICMSVLGSSRGGLHGCEYAERVHGDLARAALSAAIPQVVEQCAKVAEADGFGWALDDLPSTYRARIADRIRSQPLSPSQDTVDGH